MTNEPTTDEPTLTVEVEMHLYLKGLPENLADLKRRFVEEMQRHAAVACRKLALAIEERIGCPSFGPRRLPENGEDHR